MHVHTILSLHLGPKLPSKVMDSAMVPSPTDNGLLIIGGRKGGLSASNEILGLATNSSGSLEWFVLERRLRYAKYNHLALQMC